MGVPWHPRYLPTGLSATKKSRNPRRKADAAFEAAKHTNTRNLFLSLAIYNSIFSKLVLT
jgi:hypothetical protein